MIELLEFTPDYAGQWAEFLKDSNNGTLFHDLRFLSYHRPDRFRTRHLIFRREGEIIALLPAAIVTDATDRPVLKSPYGASVGGFVYPRRQSLALCGAVVARLKEFVIANGLAGAELRIGPSIYLREPDEQQSFCLAAEGFRLTQRWLTQVVSLPADPDDVTRALPKRKQEYVRAAERTGATVQQVGVENLERFYSILLRDRAKHGAQPTHTLPELRTLFERVPEHLRLFFCFIGSDIAAAALVFELNSVVAYSFYPCHDDAYDRHRPALKLGVDEARHYAARGFRHLDLGPSTFDDMRLNHGLAAFKESLGARGFCRDTWKWDR
jgi:hypothetical protein